jgi:hypothetical protein
MGDANPTEDGERIEREALEQRHVRDAYGFAFLLVLLSTLALVAAGSPLISPLAAGAGLLQVAALLVTLRVSGVRREWSLVGSIAAVVLFAGAVGLIVLGGVSARVPGLTMWVLLTLATIVAIGRRLVTYHEVNIQMVMGLLIIYMLLGMTFALGYQISDVLSSTGLLPEGQGLSGAIYYSFVTLATLGYGDVVPGNDIVRAMAIAEALIGQLYLVSVVSLAVSRLGVRRPARTQDDTD